MSLFEYLNLYFAVKAECKKKYTREFNARMRELKDAYRIG
jgi:hypothetical protein